MNSSGGSFIPEYQKKQSIIDTASKEERAVTDEESKKFDELEKEIRAIENTIEMADKARNINGNLSDNTSSTTESEERAFVDFIQGKISEMRAGEQNFTTANNSAIIPQTIANKVIKTVTEICPILAVRRCTT